MEGIGDRIRRLRLGLGLSQQALAGPELTRSFICRLERGKVAPSRRTLELLAARLGTSVADLTEPQPPTDALPAELRGLWTLAQHHPSPRALGETLLRLGDAHADADQLQTARDCYRRALQIAHGQPDLVATAQLRIGCCQVQLGDFAGADAAYGSALAAGDNAAQGLAWLGLGALRLEQGDLAQAEALTRQARDRLEVLGHNGAVWARHNEAVLAARAGRWAEAIDRLTEVLAVHAASGSNTLEAAALEEIAECFLAHGYLLEALEVGRRALALLPAPGAAFLRGRLYRLAARTHAAAGDGQRAYDLALVSLELFRQLGAASEAAQTEAFLAMLRT